MLDTLLRSIGQKDQFDLIDLSKQIIKMHILPSILTKPLDSSYIYEHT